jgi:calcium/proton exchanger cax
LFVLSVFAIVPLAGLLSHATESVAAKTGDAVGGLLNTTLGNLTELVIALTALRAGQFMLVKASVAGAIVTNTLFMLGASFLLGRCCFVCGESVASSRAIWFARTTTSQAARPERARTFSEITEGLNE